MLFSSKILCLAIILDVNKIMKNVQSNIAFTFNVLSETVKVLCDSVNDRYNAIKKVFTQCHCVENMF